MRTQAVNPMFVQKTFDWGDSSPPIAHKSYEVNSTPNKALVIKEAAMPAFIFSALSIVSRLTDNFSMFGKTIGNKLSLGIDSVSASFIAILGLLCFTEFQHTDKSKFI